MESGRIHGIKEELEEETPSGIFQAPWESKKHWLCRRKFIEDHKEVHGVKRAISLSMVWANINFLGCQYSTKVNEKVMYYPVPEDNEIERWLKVHPNIDMERPSLLGKRDISKRSDMHGESVDDSSNDHTKSLKLNEEESSSDLMPFEALTNQLDSFITMIRKDRTSEPSNSSNNNNNNHILTRDEIIKILAKTCFCNLCFLDTHVVSKLAFLVQKSHLTLSFNFDESSDNLGVLINNQLIGTWKGSSKKALKADAATEIITEVVSFQVGNQPVCPSSKQVLIQKKELLMSHKPISTDNVGRQLLLKMGWNGKGENTSLLTTATVNLGRVGFGGKTSSLSKNDIRSRLNQFLMNEHETQLKFPPDLSPQDRKVIHTLSGQYNLLHKSYGKDDKRYLVVTKKI